jgi:hypothetical protein
MLTPTINMASGGNGTPGHVAGELFKMVYAGHVAARVVKAGDQPNLHRIGNSAENNRNGRCCRLCCLRELFCFVNKKYVLADD